MFTGIIETTGKILAISESGTNKTFWISSPVSGDLKPDQSVAHNGVCLTVEEIKNEQHRVTAVKETLEKSNLGGLKVGDDLNIERCLPFNGRLDGHLVQGHVDATGVCHSVTEQNGSWLFTFQYPGEQAHLIVEKGSISLNGISLTVFNVTRSEFSVAIIPYTFEHTNMKHIVKNSVVNLEFDIIGKYVQKGIEVYRNSSAA
ncbi:MAG: riboflavin synthase [Lacibacter sp.]